MGLGAKNDWVVLPGVDMGLMVRTSSSTRASPSGAPRPAFNSGESSPNGSRPDAVHRVCSAVSEACNNSGDGLDITSDS